MAKKKTVSDVLRDAVKKDGRSMSAIAREAGIAPIMLSRFLKGFSISLSTASKLCRALGLELRPKG